MNYVQIFIPTHRWFTSEGGLIMQSATYQHHNQRLAGPLKTQNQFMAHRRDNFKHRSIQAAVREWESTLPGQAQEKIAQLVAEQWAKEGAAVSRSISRIYSGI
jgi:predicted Abi (CAAX) family protease